MPTISSYLNGMSAGMAGGNPSPSARGVISGWSPAAVRRHTKWLYSVEADQLTGQGYGVTLTMRDIPESSDDFHAAREAFLLRMRRWGAVRFHWVVEWTERKRPHLHMAIYFPEDWTTHQSVAAGRIISSWIAVAGKWGTGSQGQMVAPITGTMGWLQYLSKHAARGVSHYQRQGKPAGWEKTGRLWGYSRHGWPTADPMVFSVSTPAYWRFRRLVRSWRIADARAAIAAARTPSQGRAARRRLVQARRMLSCGSRRLSEVRGVNEWIPEAVAGFYVALLAAEGHTVLQR